MQFQQPPYRPLLVYQGTDINEVFWQLAKASLDWPIETRRGGDKLHDSPGPVMIEIASPQQRVLNVGHRNNNIAATCAETLWVLAGRNDIEWLKFYLPRAGDFSDDGDSWRAGYGPRLRGCIGEEEEEITRTDQLACVVKELQQSPDSRRAVMSLLEPDYDYGSLHSEEGTKDFPCTQSLSFMVRDGKLDLTVFIRSNDLIWGWSGVNVFEFAAMQELVANMIKKPVGKYFMISNNLHVYERHWKLAERVANLVDVSQAYSDWIDPKYARIDSIKRMDDHLANFFKVEERMRSDLPLSSKYPADKTQRWFFGMLLDDLISVVLAYCAFKKKAFDEAAEIRNMISDRALRASYDRLVAWEQSRPSSAVPE
jgi:thymidylate synthase